MNPDGYHYHYDSYYHFWTGLLMLGFLYNAISICMLVFDEFQRDYYRHLLLLNAITDLLNLADLIVQGKREFLDYGLLVTDSRLTISKYVSSCDFLFDLLAILPTDTLLFIWPHFTALRINRLFKMYRIREFIHLTEHRLPWPLAFRFLRLATMCYLLFHWNACFYYSLSAFYGYENSTFDDWTFSFQKIPDLLFPLNCDPRFDVYLNECLFRENDWRNRPMRINELRSYWENRIDATKFNNLTKKYAMTFYWSALTLVTLGEQPWPANSVQTVFEIVDTLIGLLIFAAIIGDIGIMVSNTHLAKAKFQEFVDSSKHYMLIRDVNHTIRDRVINWIKYQWIWGEQGRGDIKGIEETELFSQLPSRLAMELISESYLSAFLHSAVFYLCERALLAELALHLESRQFSPGDIVCRRGEIAKEMFIVRHGRLEMLLEENFNVEELTSNQIFINQQAMLKANESERFLLENDLYADWALVSESKIPYTVRSIGFSRLYFLNRDEMAAAFAEYPQSRRMVRRKANLLCKQHEQRWNTIQNIPKTSFESADFVFHHRLSKSKTQFITDSSYHWNEENDSNNDDDNETDANSSSTDFMAHYHTTLEDRLKDIQCAVEYITNKVQLAETTFVNSSMELKQWLSALEREYREQRPRLKSHHRQRQLQLAKIAVNSNSE